MKKTLLGLLALIVLAFAGLAIFVMTFNVDSYRGQIAQELSDTTGRKVSLNGPLKLNLSLSGVTLSIQDAAISNPSWASRPVMAGIGHFDLGIAVPPLLEHKLDVSTLDAVNADIDLEATGSENNWTFKLAEPKTAAPAPKVAAKSSSPVAINVNKLSIKDSQVTYRADGKISVFKVSTLSIGGVGGATVQLKAEYNGVPIDLNIKTGVANLLAPSGAWPFTADLTYANYKLTAEGKADLDKKTASISSYDLTAGSSTIKGDLTANWAGAKPALRGTLTSASIKPSDFTVKTDAGAKETPKPAAQPTAKRVFSDETLALDGLKSVNAAFNVKIDDIVLTNGSLKQTTATLNLTNGLLAIAPFKTNLGSGTISGDIKISGASNPAQLSVQVSSPNIELQDLLTFAAAPTFLSGKANFNVNIASSGNTTHALASNSVGVINLIAAGGNVSSSEAQDISSTLMQLFAPGGSNTLNCIAARFIVKNGVAQDNGILADTSATTVLGKGGFNLGQETLDLTLRAKAKSVNIGDVLPAAYIGGTFTDPHFSVDPSEVIKNVAGLLTGGGTAGSTVPNILSQPGQNACVYTLEHPVAQTATPQGVLQPGLAGKASDVLKNAGGLLKGIMGGQ